MPRLHACVPQIPMLGLRRIQVHESPSGVTHAERASLSGGLEDPRGFKQLSVNNINFAPPLCSTLYPVATRCNGAC
eukprot:1139927-Pelagomonas_calceolata.AAC.1